MLAFKDEALATLYQFPKSGIRDALEEMVIYTTDRNI